MGVVVQFDYAQFILEFPQFAYLTQPQLLTWFNLATLYQRNDGGGPICTPELQSQLLNLVTAHLTQLFAPRADGQPAPSIVGRVSNATQGSVSVATENQYPPGSAQWWQQTPWGSAWWEATKAFRTMRYIPGCPSPTEPWPIAGTFFGSNWGGWGR